MGKHNKRWGRLNDNNVFVEFTFDDPKGRFHPSLIWVEVDPTTKLGSKLTLISSVDAPVDPRDIKGDGETEKVLEDRAKGERPLDEQAHDVWLQAQEDMKKPLPEFTIQNLTN